MKNLSLGILIAVAATSSAWAGPVTLNEERCVDVSAQAAIDSITAYEEYSTRPGSVFKVSDYSQYTDSLKLELGVAETFIGDARLLTMVKSQKGKVTTLDGKEYTGLWIVLQPVNLQKGNLYPRFYLQCTFEKISDTHFVQSCFQDLKKQHYAMEQFDTVLDINQGACEDGKTKLSFKLNAYLNSDQVGEIKGEFPGFISVLFEEVDFFTSYYENFYNGWVSTLTR